MHSLRHHHIQPLLLLSLALMLLVTRLTGVHWHLCGDGLESPVELHWSEPGLEDDGQHAAASIHDTDLCIASDTLISPEPRLPTPFTTLTLWFACAFAPPPSQPKRPPNPLIPVIGHGEHYTPGPRAPPL